MASLNRCSVCTKRAGTCFCPGCNAYFCDDDFHSHRGKLLNELDGLTIDRNEIQAKITEAFSNNQSVKNVLVKIDEWQQKNIERIKQAADTAKQQVLQIMNAKQKDIKIRFQTLSQELQELRDTKGVVEQDIARLQQEIRQINDELALLVQSPAIELNTKHSDQIVWNQMIYVEEKSMHSDYRISQINPSYCIPNISYGARWAENGVTIAGGHGEGDKLNQLNHPVGIYVDHDLSIYIADQQNHRIVRWKRGATYGPVVAGGNGEGNRTNQLSKPKYVIVDKLTDSLIICDNGNRRVMRWSRRNRTSGEIIIDNIDCMGLAMDDQQVLYVSDWDNSEVRRYQLGEKNGTIVAGGNGKGEQLNQLNGPFYIIVDQDYSVYVSDRNNHRVMKWMKGAKEGIVVVGNKRDRNDLAHLTSPKGILVDQLGSMYVVNGVNHRVLRFQKNVTQGNVMVGSKGQGEQANQLSRPNDLSFDRYGNLYVSDLGNNRIQCFSLQK
ncbi:unnamed protein product [Rotaria magnacalcarata]|uniref:Uncharacterized protein n=2 Tax=Rotaria magnacalcarata TaxID=392030 RepID=A0A819SBQ0_9BILA|nr:unnamed protein product [Rotaria magnacalcarata]CAF2117545.1 unnamed protein product [Rotaria magnacalcarata]CAF3911860.1 unnamed protein product [Rotaria magnacalcarata]CAF4056966.1 unnamed protein product [Rotaria magnacalcarata]